MHITLYRKYRPKNFDEIVGEQEIVQTLRNSLKSNRLAHAYLFTGSRGVGKTSMARLMAKGLNCLKNGITDTPCNECENCLEINKGNFLDLIEIDAASNRGIDEIRQLKEKINYSPTKGRKKVYIIDEVHMLTKEAFNALLKTLEEPPAHVLFILATTEPDKILSTIISRCQRYDFKTINYKDMREHLISIVEDEKYEIDEESLVAVFENSEGSMRDSISILERLIVNAKDNKISIEETESILGITSTKLIDKFIDIIKEKNQEEGIIFLEELWKNSIDIDIFFKDLAKRSKDRILNQSLKVELGLKIIDTVYEVISKFHYEEDKKLIGYVILNKLTEQITLQKVENINSLPEVQKIEPVTKNIETDEKINLNFEDIKKSWETIKNEVQKIKFTIKAFLITAYLKSYKDNTLVIELPSDQEFALYMLESDKYYETFVNVVRKVLNANIKIKFQLAEGKEIEKAEDKSFSEDIISFFGGERIES